MGAKSFFSGAKEGGGGAEKVFLSLSSGARKKMGFDFSDSLPINND